MLPRSTRLFALLLGSSAAIAAMSVAAPAAAKGPPLRACATAYDDGQGRVRAGHLREAKDLFLRCAKTACGGFQRRCAAAADQTSADLARVAIVVTDAMDAPLVDVLVKMDGETLATHLDGRALAIDPGVHEFTFGARVGEPVRYVWTTRKIMVAEGQREPITVTMPPPHEAETDTALSDAATLAARQLDADRAQKGDRGQPTDKAGADTVSSDEDASGKETSETSEAKTGETSAKEPDPAQDATLAAIESSSSVAPRRRGSAVPWVIGGLGVLGLGAGGALLSLSKEDNAALARCSPNCKPSSVETVHQLTIASDASFAAGGAVVGLAVVLLLTLHPHEAAPASGGASRARPTYSFDVRPTPSGAVGVFGAVF
ncbi:MAG: hypothetical protein ACLQBL_37675 [Polyangiaceae bacterium]